jgi:hypothetical protein
MPSIIVPRRRLIQPQGRIEVAPEWSRGLLEIYAGPDSVVAQSGAVQRAVYAAGVGSTAPTSNIGYQVGDKRMLAGLNASSAVAIFSTRGLTASASGRPFYCERSESLEIYKFGTGFSTTTSIGFVFRNKHGNLINNGTTVSIDATREIHVAALVTNGSNSRTIFCDGNINENTDNYANDFDHALDRRICGDAMDGSVHFDGGLLGLALFARALSRDELSELSRNPWQMYRATPRRLYFDVSSSYSVPTLSSAMIFDITASSARPGCTLTF